MKLSSVVRSGFPHLCVSNIVFRLLDCKFFLNLLCKATLVPSGGITLSRYILQVYRLSTSDCGRFTTCDDCLAVSSPLCGWCTLIARWRIVYCLITSLRKTTGNFCNLYILLTIKQIESNKCNKSD